MSVKLVPVIKMDDCSLLTKHLAQEEFRLDRIAELNVSEGPKIKVGSVSFDQ